MLLLYLAATTSLESLLDDPCSPGEQVPLDQVSLALIPTVGQYPSTGYHKVLAVSVDLLA